MPPVGRLFTTEYSAIGNAAKEAYKRERIALFAEALSDVGEVKATCARLGIAQSTGTLYLKQMRADLGAQAA